MDLTFHEKSLWVMFVGLVVGFGFYFANALAIRTPDVMPQQIALFTVAVAILVVVQVVGHVVVALIDRRAITDERARMIGLAGSRNAGYVLATGVFFALCTAIVTRGNFLFTHVLLAFWVLAQLVEIGSQLFLHRRGA